MFKLWKSKLGQGMTEYILIVALVAIVGIVAFKVFGSKVGTMISGMGDKLDNVSDVVSEVDAD
jgi:Flp pilus assembly pilin Flp